MVKCKLCGEEKKDKRLKIYFCPKCKSFDVYHPFRISNLFGIIPMWQCRKCNFKAVQFPLFETTQEKINEAKKNLTKKVKKKKIVKKSGRRK